MSIPVLDVLRIQAEHIRQLADTLRQHLNSHAASSECGLMAGRHLDTGEACTESISVLARHVHACITCAIDAAKPMPVCAGDRKRDPKPDSGDDPRWQGPEYDKYEADERRPA